MKKIFILLFVSILSLVSFGQDVIEVTFDKFYDDPSYTPEETITDRRGNTVTIGGDWYVSLVKDDARFIFDYYGGTPDSFTGNYTIDNIDTGFSYGYYQGTRVNYATCDLTITETHPSANLTRYVLEADIVTDEGTHYLVHANHDVLTATETVMATILDAKITPTDYGFLLTATNDAQNLDINLAIKWSFGIEGYFGTKVVDADNTVITHNGKSFDPLELEMEIVFADKLTNGDPGYRIERLYFLSPDVEAYELNIEAPILVTDTVDITCTNLAWDESQKAESSIMFEASNASYSLFGMLSATSIKAGTYEGDKVSIELTEIATDKSISALQTTAVVSGNILKGYTVEVQMLGTDHKRYLVHLSKSKETTNVENLEVMTGIKKIVVDGQLVIIKNGVQYTILGATIK